MQTIQNVSQDVKVGWLLANKVLELHSVFYLFCFLFQFESVFFGFVHQPHFPCTESRGACRLHSCIQHLLWRSSRQLTTITKTDVQLYIIYSLYDVSVWNIFSVAVWSISSTGLVTRCSSAWVKSAEPGCAPDHHRCQNCHDRWETAEKMCLRRRIGRRRPSPWMCGSLAPGLFWPGSSWSLWTQRQGSPATSVQTSLTETHDHVYNGLHVIYVC